MKRPIAISLSPNTEKDDVVLALKMLFSPMHWFSVNETKKLEERFAGYFGKKYKAVAVNSGRSAEYLILKALGIGSGDEVALQAFTCIAVANSVIWLKARPLYVDIDKSYNLDPKDLQKKITPHTKAVIVQHAFGIPASYEAIKKIGKKNKLVIIEDCAVALGAEYKKKKVGALGDISFFSFGRDKIISSVFGGMILCKDDKLYWRLKEERSKLSYPSPFWVIQQLLHPILFSLILPTYNFGYKKLTLGKALLFFFQKIKLLSKPVYSEEKSSNRPKIFPTKMPGALAALAVKQFDKLEKYNKHSNEIANLYFNELKKTKTSLPPKVTGAVWLRFPIVVKDKAKILAATRKAGILLGDWYKSCVYPAKDVRSAGYRIGSCPKAESAVKSVINLPTYPTLSKADARHIVKIIKPYG